MPISPSDISIRTPVNITNEPTLSAHDYSMPAEWELHEATWICWPHNPTDWPDKMEAVQFAYIDIVRHLLQGENVHILIANEETHNRAQYFLKDAGLDSARIHFVRQTTNSSWTRDYGPMFAKHNNTGDLAVYQFQFNGWSKYPEFDDDNRVSFAMATHLELPSIYPYHKQNFVVLEGGAIDVNGAGSVLATEECLLDQTKQVRNPGFTRTDMEKIFSNMLGASQTIWLGRGIVGDDTHGHIDDLCRFVSSDTVVVANERNPQDANYSVLRDHCNRLSTIRMHNESTLNVVELPMPAPVVFRGTRLPASYTNFYITNSSVLVPTFNDINDRIALGILDDLFPERQVIGIHATDLVWGHGSIHCLTQQQPA